MLAGSLLLEHFNVKRSEGLLYSMVGLTIVTMAMVNLFKMLRGSQQREANRDRSHCLPANRTRAVFSSEGVAALGSIAPLGLTTLTAGQVVGTDMFFGLAMPTIGGRIQLHAGNYAPELIWKLIVLEFRGRIWRDGCRRVRLRYALWV